MLTVQAKSVILGMILGTAYQYAQAGGRERRQVGHSILMSIHLCKHPEWKQ